MKTINRKTLPKWTRHLTAAEIKHLYDVHRRLRLSDTTSSYKRQLKEMPALRCYDCIAIGRRLVEAGVIKEAVE